MIKFENPIVVGKPEDWYAKNDEGEIISKDAYGKNTFDSKIWASKRRTGNDTMIDCRDDGVMVGACVGGSNVSIVAGLLKNHLNGCERNTFNGRNSFFHQIRCDEKTFDSKDEADKRDSETLFAVGHAYEDSIAQMALETINTNYCNDKFGLTGLKGYLVDDQRMFQCGAVDEDGVLFAPHCMANGDRFIYFYPKNTIVNMDDEQWVIDNPPVKILNMEIKTKAMAPDENKTIKELMEEVLAEFTTSKYHPLPYPENYGIQCQFYNGIFNVPGTFLCCQAVNMNPKNMIIRYIPRDNKVIERIFGNAEKFISDSLEGKAPSLNDGGAPDKELKERKEYIDIKKKDTTETPVDISSMRSYIEEYVQTQALLTAINKKTKEEVRPLAKRLSELEAFICEGMDSANATVGETPLDYGKGRVTYTANTFTSYNDDVFDRMKVEDPEVYEEFVVETAPARKVLLSKKGKKVNADLKKILVEKYSTQTIVKSNPTKFSVEIIDEN